MEKKRLTDRQKIGEKKTSKGSPDSEGALFLAPILFVLSCFMIFFRLLGRSRVYLSWEKNWVHIFELTWVYGWLILRENGLESDFLWFGAKNTCFTDFFT